MDDMKKNVYGKKLENKAIGYKTGAIVGGAAGFLAGWLLRSKIMWWTIGGVVGGGYIGYKIAETNDPDLTFVNIEAEKLNKKTKKK